MHLSGALFIGKKLISKNHHDNHFFSLILTLKRKTPGNCLSTIIKPLCCNMAHLDLL